MRRSPKSVAALALVVALACAVSACGESEPSQAEITQQREQLTKALGQEVSRRDGVSAEARVAACNGQVGRALALAARQPDTNTDIYVEDVDSYREQVMSSSASWTVYLAARSERHA
jgi:hypothetical protein